MQTYMLISFIADDRPGLVQSLSEAVAAHEGNWLESRMSNLAGKFAGIVNVAVPQQRVAELETALGDLAELGLTLRLEASRPGVAVVPHAPYRLDIVGQDRPGIVHEFAAALANRHINVTELRSDITSAPMSASPLFTASVGIDVPAHIDLDELRERLEAIADELTIDYSLVPAAD
jgi:glycine cleavage system regulatory protein